MIYKNRENGFKSCSLCFYIFYKFFIFYKLVNFRDSNLFPYRMQFFVSCQAHSCITTSVLVFPAYKCIPFSYRCRNIPAKFNFRPMIKIHIIYTNIIQRRKISTICINCQLFLFTKNSKNLNTKKRKTKKKNSYS